MDVFPETLWPPLVQKCVHENIHGLSSCGREPVSRAKPFVPVGARWTGYCAGITILSGFFRRAMLLRRANRQAASVVAVRPRRGSATRGFSAAGRGPDTRGHGPDGGLSRLRAACHRTGSGGRWRLLTRLNGLARTLPGLPPPSLSLRHAPSGSYGRASPAKRPDSARSTKRLPIVAQCRFDLRRPGL